MTSAGAAPSAGPRCGPSGAPITRCDPWQIGLIPPVVPPGVEPRRLLVGFLHGLGDNLMLAPSLRALRARLPRTEFVLLVRGDIPAADLWEGNDLLAAVLRYPGPAPRYWHPGYRLGPDRRLGRELARIGAACGADRIAHVTGLAFPNQLARPLDLPHTHRVIAAQLGVDPGSFRYELPVRDEHRAAAGALFPAGAAPAVAMNRCGSTPLKLWSLAAYEETAAALRERGYRIVHCYGPGTREMERARDGRNAVLAPGDVSTEDLADARLLVTAAVLERCRFVVTVDTALMHLAAGLGKPLVGLFTWPVLMNGHAFEPTHRIVAGQPRASRIIAEIATLPGRLLASPTVHAASGSPTRDDLSVVIATLNEERNLPRLLDSLERNGIEPGAIVVADKGSRDRTASLAAERGVAVVRGGRNSSDQRNLGAAVARGRYLAFLDADMELAPGQIDEWVALLAHAPCLTIPEISIPSDRLGRARALERSFIGENPAIESARVFRRDIFEEAGGYRVDLYGCEDWVLSEFVLARHPSARARIALLHHEGRVTARGVFRKYRRYGRGYFALLRENGRAFVRHAGPVRPRMLADIVRAARAEPGLGLAWMQFRALTYAGGLAGLVDGLFDASAGRAR